MLLSFLRREDKRLPLFNLQAKAVSLLPDCGAALGNCRYSQQASFLCVLHAVAVKKSFDGGVINDFLLLSMVERIEHRL